MQGLTVLIGRGEDEIVLVLRRALLVTPMLLPLRRYLDLCKQLLVHTAILALAMEGEPL